MPAHTFTATITALEQVKHSENGNPRFQFYFDDHRPLLSKADVATAYEWTSALVGKTMQIHVNSAPNVIDVTEVPDEGTN